ncbi:MAG: TonB family protein [Bdellovibrionaceae bacterium]|nr:TonB family protein [Pseudobdellovibrionaceae bacterium]
MSFVLLSPFALAKNGGLHRSQIQSVIQTNISGVMNCYEEAERKTPGIAGRIKITFEVAADGRVRKTQISESSLKNKQAEDCVVAESKKWIFPKPVGGEIVEVHYPFAFEKNSPLQNQEP